MNTENSFPMQQVGGADAQSSALVHPKTILARDPEPMPDRLARFVPGCRFERDSSMSGRVVFYPGSGLDGQAVKLFGGSHGAHTFIMVDFGMDAERIAHDLDAPGTFRGYRSMARLSLGPSDLSPAGWSPTLPVEQPGMPPMPCVRPYAFLEILERVAPFGQDHGPARLAILFIGGDGIATFDALFCQRHDPVPPPFGLVLQDHGFGGNYDRSGAEGSMARIASARQVWPRWLWVAASTLPWPGYQPVAGAWPMRGGSTGDLRRLYARK